jgi:hypothetical protein
MELEQKRKERGRTLCVECVRLEIGATFATTRPGRSTIPKTIRERIHFSELLVRMLSP